MPRISDEKVNNRAKDIEAGNIKLVGDFEAWVLDLRDARAEIARLTNLQDHVCSFKAERDQSREALEIAVKALGEIAVTRSTDTWEAKVARIALKQVG